MDWEYQEEIKIDDWVGFVYLITNLKNGRKYIGQKKFWSTKTTYSKNPKTGLKKKKRTKVESDWKNYFGSNEELKREVQEIGPDNFKREIIHLCKSKGMMNYLELKEQMDNNVLVDPNFYNSFVGMRIHRSHVKYE